MQSYFVNAFKYKQWANAELLAMGEAQLDALNDADRTFFLRILNHTAVVDSLFISRISTKPEQYQADNTDATPTLAELREFITAQDDWLVAYTETITAAELNRVITFHFTDGDNGQLAVHEILLHLLTHGSNHRGMASRTLAINGLERPKDTFTRFLHQYQPQRRSANSNSMDRIASNQAPISRSPALRGNE